jgi:hypothetical protein
MAGHVLAVTPLPMVCAGDLHQLIGLRNLAIGPPE